MILSGFPLTFIYICRDNGATGQDMGYPGVMRSTFPGTQSGSVNFGLSSDPYQNRFRFYALQSSAVNLSPTSVKQEVRLEDKRPASCPIKAQRIH